MKAKHVRCGAVGVASSISLIHLHGFLTASPQSRSRSRAIIIIIIIIIASHEDEMNDKYNDNK